MLSESVRPQVAGEKVLLKKSVPSFPPEKALKDSVTKQPPGPVMLTLDAPELTVPGPVMLTLDAPALTAPGPAMLTLDTPALTVPGRLWVQN